MGSVEIPGPRRVLLVGFMGSGKSTVGRVLAAELGWCFSDFDDAVESEVGAPIPEIFAQRGEAFFRKVEDRVARRLLERDRIVLASGGGWPVREGRMDRLPAETLSVWLRVSPEEAVRRARADEGERPLLAGDDPVERARDLLEERAPEYGKAALILDSESAPPRGLARTIVEYLRVQRSAVGAPGTDRG